MMTMKEAVDYINAHTWSQWKLGLSRTRDLLALLGDPQKKLRFVHVAGSNGKGSTCAMLERILREAGYVTGLYPSPYIEDFRERIQVSGEYITEEALCRITARVRELADSMEDHPTQFELITAIGMVYFAEKKCDIVVLEVGLGGRFDSTNIIDAPEAAVITNIGLEHTEYLGSTLAEIAGNKSGIIKTGADVVCYENAPEAMEVIRSVCEEKGCPLHIARFDRIQPVEKSLDGQTFYFLKNTEEDLSAEGCRKEADTDLENYDGTIPGTGLTDRSRTDSASHPAPLRLSLPGEYQLHNAATALTTVEVLRERGFVIPEEAVRRGLAKTEWPARFEVLSREPVFILDGGHNPQCASALAESLRQYLPETERSKDSHRIGGSGEERGGIVFLMGMLSDKDYHTVIDIISPFAAAFVCLTPDSPRALPAQELADELTERGFQARACYSPEEGIRTALEWASGRTSSGGLIPGPGAGLPVVAFGSLYMAGALRHAFPRTLRNYIYDIKNKQRAEAKRRRRALTKVERAEKSASVCRQLRELPQLRGAGTVFSYAAASDEVNLDEFNSFLEKKGVKVCYPVCTEDGGRKKMFAALPAAGTADAWRTGAYGIRVPNPENSVPVDPAEIDAVLVPCVVFDRHGGRCGHGAGYYDRFFKDIPRSVPKILIAFDVQEAVSVAMEKTDERMDLAVTESGVVSEISPC